jgi:hypothetical protein
MSSSIFKSKRLISKFKTTDTNNIVFDKLHQKISFDSPSIHSKKIPDKNIKTNFQKGDLAPNAYTGYKEFPDWYKPYTTNYFGNGFLFCSIVGLSFAAFVLYKQTLYQQGRKSIINYRDDHWIFNSPTLRGRLNKDLRERDIPIFNYTKRYIKESGF